MKKLFLEHLGIQKNFLETLLNRFNLEGIVISAGWPFVRPRDDQDLTFRADYFFSHLCPLETPGHLLYFKAGEKPKLLAYLPDDFWHEHKKLDDEFWVDGFDIELVSDKSRFTQFISELSIRTIGIGDYSVCGAGKVSWNPGFIFPILDWRRAEKTPYEIHCLEEATKLGAKGHILAKECFDSNPNELLIHFAFLKGAQLPEELLPYGTIVAIDEKGAFLHYKEKRNQLIKESKVLLIDAGASVMGYASDITRTYTTKRAHPVFCELVIGLNKLQLETCAKVKAGVSFKDLQLKTYEGILALLKEKKILRGSTSELEEKNIVRAFFPHGIGHMLGLQVHDVGGRQMNELGDEAKPLKDSYLRMIRSLRENEVVTMEPGIYFIPMLLNPHRSNEETKHLFDWKLIDELIPCGGIRIEDNLVVKADCSVNLTRKYLP